MSPETSFKLEKFIWAETDFAEMGWVDVQIWSAFLVKWAVFFVGREKWDLFCANSANPALRVKKERERLRIEFYDYKKDPGILNLFNGNEDFSTPFNI